MSKICRIINELSDCFGAPEVTCSPWIWFANLSIVIIRRDRNLFLVESVRNMPRANSLRTHYKNSAYYACGWLINNREFLFVSTFNITVWG